MANRNILFFDTIDSTNTFLKENYQAYPSKTIVRAQFQTNGRGQFDRSWDANKGENLLFSVLFKGDLGFPVQWMNPIIVSTLLTVLKEYGIDAHYKEPNDIYIGDKKVAGILIETKYHQQLMYLILGVGLNVNQETFGSYPATSLRQVINQMVDIDQLFERILHYLDHQLLLMELIRHET